MWILYGVSAMLLLAGMLLLIKFAGTYWTDSTGIMFVLCLGLLFCSSIHLLAAKQALIFKWQPVTAIAAASILSYIGNLLYIKAVALAPNPGYPVAIEGNKAVIVLLLSCLLFGAEFSIEKLIGVILCFTGVFFIVR
jgi:hypothetical protein